jgi:hypothetical protein
MSVWRLAALLLVSCSLTATAQSQNPPGASPVSSGTIHSSPESPDKPRSWGDGQPAATNPSTNEPSKQPSAGGRDTDGSDPTRPGAQGRLFKRS